MKLTKIIDSLEKWAPPIYQESYDNSGLLIGNKRNEIKGSTAKIYAQKGTGNARHASKKAPIFIGGGVAHGPKGNIYKVRNFKKKSDVAQYGTGSAMVQIGVIAQEVEAAGMDKLVEHSPPSKFVSGSLGITDSVKNVKYSVLYMKAVKALQEAMTRIEILETQMAQVSGSN